MRADGVAVDAGIDGADHRAALARAAPRPSGSESASARRRGPDGR